DTPSSALGSSRHKLKDEDLPLILERFKKYDIRYLFMIGGNDTMDTIHRITEHATSVGYPMTGIGVPKTVDNDLFGVDHTPGYPSAARYVALSVQQGGRLARDMQRVDQFCVFQTVGRSAGWLPAAAALARRAPGDAPHIILMPERPFDRDKFLAAVKSAHEKHGFVSIVCGEGISYADGTPVSASRVTDNFANVEFGAMGGTSAAMMLHRMISDTFGWRGEFQVTESLQMSADDRSVKQDHAEAYACGREAVKLAMKGANGVMVTLERASKPGRPYRAGFGTIPLKEVAVHARPMDDKLIGPDGMDVSRAFIDYARPLVGELPVYASLNLAKAKPAKPPKEKAARGSRA
ncbi:MAG TPA: diphosphate--fructose-6-phosphate 1-phosphotransferase, partial [Planctomycetota bacterium]|nr:diphosphate--fructose-6-phosphate 1-phosphotransferase [Planctomycetota bacterium]